MYQNTSQTLYAWLNSQWWSVYRYSYAWQQHVNINNVNLNSIGHCMHITHTHVCLYVCHHLRSDSGSRPSCLFALSWAELKGTEAPQPPAPLQLLQTCRRSTRSLRSCSWTTKMMTRLLSFPTLQLLVEQSEMGTWPPLDRRTVTMMMTCRYDGGVAAVTETTGPNRLPSVCEALPPHLHHVHIGQMRYKTQDTYFVTVKTLC